MRRFSNDPHWLTVKYAGKCAKCGAPIKAGESAFYYPIGKSVYGTKCGCGDEHSRDFEAAKFDDDFSGNASL